MKMWFVMLKFRPLFCSFILSQYSEYLWSFLIYMLLHLRVELSIVEDKHCAYRGNKIVYGS